jgi:hypothetical protein
VAIELNFKNGINFLLINLQLVHGNRVARWFIFKPKISILENFGGPYVDGKMLLYLMAICR